MPLRQVQRKIQDYLCNGEPVRQIRSRGGKARILVGHGLDHDLKCLELEYPEILIRQASYLTTVSRGFSLTKSCSFNDYLIAVFQFRC